MSFDYILINPPGLYKYNEIKIDECLGLGYINASLSKEFSGFILNCYSNDIDVDTFFQNKNLLSNILSSRFVGISCNFFTAVPSTVKIVQKLREVNYRGFICLGGHQAMMSKDAFLKYLDIDAICNGDGEITIKELMKSLKANTFNYDVKGFLYKKNNNVICGFSELTLPELDELPYPTRLGDEKHFWKYDSKLIDSVYICTSRGCPYKCTYCDISTFYNRKRRQRSIDNVIKEIEYLNKSKGIKRFYFSDDNFLGGINNSFDRVMKFAQQLNDKQIYIHFSMEARVTDITYELLRLLKNVGLIHINLGVESGSQSMLDRWNKGIKVSDSINAINIAESVGVRYNVNFILSDPYTTYSELIENYKFLKFSRAIEKSEEFFGIFTNEMGVLDGTEIAYELKEKNILKPKKMRYATEEEQMILDKYHPAYYYRYLDKKVECFAINNHYWTERIEEIRSNISYDFFSSQCFRLFCFKLFKMSLNAAKDNQNIFDKVDKEIQRFFTLNKVLRINTISGK